MSTWWSIAEPPERLRERLQATLLARVAVVSVFLGMLAWGTLRGETNFGVSIQVLVWVIAATYAFTIVSAVLLLRARNPQGFASLQLGFDLCLTTWVLYATGGAESPFAFLYNLVVLSAATLFGGSGAVVTAACGSILYAGLVALLQGGWVILPGALAARSVPDAPFAVRFVSTNATFFIIALLAGSLVKRARVSERLLEQREAERDRLATLQEAVAQNIESALVTTDGSGRVTSVNRVAEDLLGLAGRALLGVDVGEILPPLRNTAGGLLQFLQSSSSAPTEFSLQRSADDERVLRCSATVVRDTYQNPIGGLLILQDVTTLRRLEQSHLEMSQAAAAAASEPIASEVPVVDGLVGDSPALIKVRDFIAKAARSDATVLVAGESGTGKELVARAIHARSARGAGPFVPVNCGAIPENLIETELFGHARGAFTGAVSARAGLFRSANGGTVFLDEIGELPLALQVKLLRVLQEHSFMPVGSDAQVTVDVRIVAATNRSLSAEVEAGRFREDLYYRLNVLTIDLPPLRERRGDVSLLVSKFVQQFADLHRKPVTRLTAATLKRLDEYAYPGNVRELENILEHAVALAEGDTIQETDLPEYVLRRTPHAAPLVEAPRLEPQPSVVPARSPEAAAPADLLVGFDNLDDNLAAYEKAIILRALNEAGGVKKRAADLLGINYRSFRHRLQKYGLNDPGDPDIAPLERTH